jgi:hypothetical protein
MRGISAGGIFSRFLIAFAMVALTWNPTPYNYVRWAINNWADLKPVVFLFGLIMLVAWIVYVRATMRSLGTLGIILACAIAGGLFWVMWFYGLVGQGENTLIKWVAMILIALIFTAGMSWSHLRRRWTGQVDIDDVDDVGH